MKTKRIPQPFVVLHSFKPDSTELVTDWCRENITSCFYAFTTSSLMNMYELALPAPGSYDWVSKPHDNLVIFMFECPRDALLFKLTWGGE